jgi:hypothetical protein
MASTFHQITTANFKYMSGSSKDKKYARLSKKHTDTV